MKTDDLYDRLRHVSDSAWLELLIESTRSSKPAGLSLPAFPSEATQAQFTGSASAATINEAFTFYRGFKQYCAQLGMPIGPETRLLDFGVGWGRLMRMFLKDIPARNLYGCDIDPDILGLCRQLGLPGNLDRLYHLGRLPYPDGYFTAMTAYSVFTHLPEQVHLHWMRELARVASAGCVFCLTLEPRRFIDFVETLPEQGALSSSWHQYLANFAPRADELRAAFDSGEIAYIPSGGGDWRSQDVYGDAVVPLGYVERNWNEFFEVREYVDEPRLWQAVLVVQRK